jgi:outer membrane lipoprotein-sorting protein
LGNKYFATLAISLIFAVITSPLVLAENMEGLRIAKEMKSRNVGWEDSISTFNMELIDANDKTITRKIRVNSIEVDGGGEKTLTIFDEPKDIQGTALLSYSHIKKPDDQWIFLPALKRVKRISPGNKSGPFVGSEMSYEDLSPFQTDKYQFTYLRDETYNSRDTFVIEQIPFDEYSGYSRQLLWIHKDNYYPLKIEFYDFKESLLKTLNLNDYKLHLGKYWRAHNLLMLNHKTKKSTRLLLESITFKNGLTENDFSRSKMKRSR